MIRVTTLFHYPVKGMHGISALSESVTPWGFHKDRRWMVVKKESGRFLTQRECPVLARFRVKDIDYPNAFILLSFERNGWEEFKSVPKEQWETGERILVTIWRETVEVVDQGDKIALWLSERLERDVRLVYLPDDVVRPSRGQYEEEKRIIRTGFADGFPLLLTSEESLTDLNSRLTQPIPMNRFRPNIVVSGCSRPFEEETWRLFRIGNVLFRGMKRCGRCVVITTDQETGERKNKECLDVLKENR